MRIVTVSNYFNHHQKPLSDALNRITNGGFSFVATSEMDKERKSMGWGMKEVPEYVVDASQDTVHREKALKLIRNADVVLWGDAPVRYVKKRLHSKKLTFRCTERIFKKGFSVKAFLPRAIKHKLLNWPCRKQYLLGMGAYAAGDYERIGLYKNKAYRWGYFTETKKYDLDRLFLSKSQNEKPVILWTARMIPLKHPEAALYVAEKLKQAGIRFEMDMIGGGELESSIACEIHSKGLEDCVKLLGMMSPQEVRRNMEKADVFLFTSDQNEGWGAVLNESMNSGCAVVANQAIGSVPFLIKNGENGFVYPNGDFDQLYCYTRKLIEDPKLRHEVGNNAYCTMTEEWSAESAAQKLVKISEQLIAGKEDSIYDSGCGSKIKETI